MFGGADLGEWLGFGSGIPHQFQEKVNQYSKITLCTSEDKVEKIPPSRKHHENVLSIDTVHKYIEKTKPLVIFDVDETILSLRNTFTPEKGWKTDPKKVRELERGKFLSFLERLKASRPDAIVVLLTNGCFTKEKLKAINIDPKKHNLIIDEPLPVGDLNRELNKGKRLTCLIESKKLQFNEIHFIDDDPVNIKDVADSVAHLNLNCHTYDFIRDCCTNHFRRWLRAGNSHNEHGFDSFYCKRENHEALKARIVKRMLMERRTRHSRTR